MILDFEEWLQKDFGVSQEVASKVASKSELSMTAEELMFLYVWRCMVGEKEHGLDCNG